MPTRAYSGRLGRAVANDYVRAMAARDAPKPAPYPIQRGLVAPMRAAAQKAGDPERMQMWAGQSARLAAGGPAAAMVERLWTGAKMLLG
jgi:nitronate monooxygenase